MDQQSGTVGTSITCPTLAEVCESPVAFLGRLDVGLLNLLSAVGLPGAESLDIDREMNWLDDAASAVDLETRRHWYRFLDSPDTYHRSPGYFCCYYLLQVLQEDFGVRYNPDRVRDASFQDPKCLDPDFTQSQDLFIHGIIDGAGGTCVSMPVLYVAVGRRLGYPLKLVEARGHLFFRWDDAGRTRCGIAERFNVEGTGRGITSFPDEYYATWPEPWAPADVAGGWYLKSLSVSEELGLFLATRGECLTDLGRLVEAAQSYEWACTLRPDDLRYRSQLARIERRITKEHAIVQEILALNHEARQRQQGPVGSVRLEPQVPPHGDYCKCFHCRRARDTGQRNGLIGHPLGCSCANCRAGLSGGIPNQHFYSQ